MISASGLNAIAMPGALTRPDGSRPSVTCGPLICTSVARHSARNSGPSANSMPSDLARMVSALLPISTSLRVSRGDGSRRASMVPVTRVCTPISRLASCSNNER